MPPLPRAIRSPSARTIRSTSASASRPAWTETLNLANARTGRVSLSARNRSASSRLAQALVGPALDLLVLPRGHPQLERGDPVLPVDEVVPVAAVTHRGRVHQLGVERRGELGHPGLVEVPLGQRVDPHLGQRHPPQPGGPLDAALGLAVAGHRIVSFIWRANLLSARIERVMEAGPLGGLGRVEPGRVGQLDAHRQALQGVHRLPHDPAGIEPPGPAEHGVGPDGDAVLAGNLPHLVSADAELLADLARRHAAGGELADQFAAAHRRLGRPVGRIRDVLARRRRVAAPLADLADDVGPGQVPGRPSPRPRASSKSESETPSVMA